MFPGAVLPPLEISPPKRFKRLPYDAEPPHTKEITMLKFTIAIGIIIVALTIFFVCINKDEWILFAVLPLLFIAAYISNYI